MSFNINVNDDEIPEIHAGHGVTILSQPQAEYNNGLEQMAQGGESQTGSNVLGVRSTNVVKFQKWIIIACAVLVALLVIITVSTLVGGSSNNNAEMVPTSKGAEGKSISESLSPVAGGLTDSHNFAEQSLTPRIAEQSMAPHSVDSSESPLPAAGGLTGQPSDASVSPSRGTGSPSDASRSPSRGTGSPSDASRSPSRGTGSPSKPILSDDPIISNYNNKCIQMKSTNDETIILGDCNLVYFNARETWSYNVDTKQIKNRAGDYCLTAYNLVENGKGLVPYACNNWPNQKFIISDDGTIKIDYDNGKCLDVIKSSGEIVIWDCHGGINQQWYYQYIYTSSPSNSPLQAVTFKSSLKSNYNNKCMRSASGVSTGTAVYLDECITWAPVAVWTYNSETKQIQNLANDYCLGVSYWDYKDNKNYATVIVVECGHPMCVYGKCIGDNEKWYVQPDDTIRMGNGKCLAVTSTNGVGITDCNYAGGSEKWGLCKNSAHESCSL